MRRNRLAAAGLMVYSWLSIKIGIIFMVISLFGHTKEVIEFAWDMVFVKQKAACPVNPALFSNINMGIGITGVILIASGIFILSVPYSFVRNKSVLSIQRQD